jgi:hypothetical protein
MYVSFFAKYDLEKKKIAPKGRSVKTKGFEICTAGLKFESGRAPLIRAWNSRDFTLSFGPTKCAFREVGFPWIKKNIEKTIIQIAVILYESIIAGPKSKFTLVDYYKDFIKCGEIMSPLPRGLLPDTVDLFYP